MYSRRGEEVRRGGEKRSDLIRHAQTVDQSRAVGREGREKQGNHNSKKKKLGEK